MTWVTRRRFIALTAAALLPGRAAAETVWQGRAFGSDLRVALRGEARAAAAALAGLPGLIARVDAAFSLHRPDSELARLNATGQLTPSADFAALLDLANRLHAATEGLFDPSVQPLWHALATGGDAAAATARIGWDRVARGAGGLRLAPGQALTFNGLAQGRAADLVRDHLAARGFATALADLGEIATLGGPWRIGIADPSAGLLAERRLTGLAIATSSARATEVGGRSHILHPAGGATRWATVTVEADSAALADGLSTALVLADREQARRIAARLPGVARVTLIDDRGDLTTL